MPVEIIDCLAVGIKYQQSFVWALNGITLGTFHAGHQQAFVGRTYIEHGRWRRIVAGCVDGDLRYGKLANKKQQRG